MSRRLLAIGALLVAAATIALAVAVAVGEFPRGLLLLGCVLITGAAAWYGVLRRGAGAGRRADRCRPRARGRADLAGYTGGAAG